MIEQHNNKDSQFTISDLLAFAMFVGPSSNKSYYKRQLEKWIASRTPNDKKGGILWPQ